MTRRKRKAARAPTHVYRCVKQTIPYAPSTSESLTWHAQQGDRAYNQTVRTALDALAKGQVLPRVAYADKDKGTPPGDSLLKRLTAWRAEESWQAVPLGIQRAAVGEAANAVERWNDTRETHALDIVQAAERAEKWPGILQQWKETIAVWNAKGRKGKKPEHPGRCKGIPRRAVRANPDERRLFKQRKKRERECSDRVARRLGRGRRSRDSSSSMGQEQESQSQLVEHAVPRDGRWCCCHGSLSPPYSRCSGQAIPVSQPQI